MLLNFTCFPVYTCYAHVDNIYITLCSKSLVLRVEVVQAALAQRKSQIESHGPPPFKRQSIRQKGPTELQEGIL